MKELGKILKEKREQLNLDLDKVHRTTKIQEKYISAIEDGAKDEFSAEIYYKSFVKSYAKFLGLNGDELLAQYEKRKCADSGADGERDDKYGKKACYASKTTKDRRNDLKKFFVTVLIACVLCAAFLYLNKNISIFAYGNPDKISALEKKKMQMQKLKDAEEKEQEEKIQRLKEIAFAEQKEKPESGIRNNSIDFSAGYNAGVSEIVSETAASAKVSDTVNKKKMKQDLTVKAVENVWIKVDGDGKEIFQGTIVKGTEKNWKADNEFTVKIGYTPGVDVFFNGIEVDVDEGAVHDVNTLVLKRQPQ